MAAQVPLAYLLSDTVDALDLKAFYEPYEGDGRRNSPYDLRIFLPQDRQEAARGCCVSSVRRRVLLSAENRERLETLSRGPKVAVRVVERAKIILLASKGKQNQEIAQICRMTRQAVGVWRRRFAGMGIDRIGGRVAAGPAGHEQPEPEVAAPTLHQVLVERVKAYRSGSSPFE